MEISAEPTKRFFVEMLTRDIELADAILDLLDNCIDGVIRQGKDATYEGFWAHINFNKNEFSIVDNCGGISEEIAKVAFRIGRSNSDRDAGLNTVGVYGIGMKRAIFKIGRNATVSTKTSGGDEFEVPISSAWMESDVWKLDTVKKETGLHEFGTEIKIDKLVPAVSEQLDVVSNPFFLTSFVEKISTIYAYIISKGFVVSVNGKKIMPKKLHLLVTQGPDAVEPFYASFTHEGVDIKIAIGLYERFHTDSELEDFEDGTRSKESAGISIICNDRVVEYANKDYKTGWGERPVPAYHSQFITIAGFAAFSSSNPLDLPLTTTKRGVDLNSKLYNLVKEQIKEGLKQFTDFTNKWKSRSEERASILNNATTIDIYSDGFKPSKQREVKLEGLKGFKSSFSLPAPKNASDQARIVFVKKKAEVQILKDYLEEQIGGGGTTPSETGSMAFDYLLAEATDGR